MTFKIKISQFYDYSWPKQWKWNKIRYFFMGHIQIVHDFSLVTKYWNISMTFVIEILMELKGTCANLTLLFLIYNVADDLNDFWNLFFDKVYWKSEWWQFPRKNLLHLNLNLKIEKNLRPGAKIATIFKLSWKYFNCFIIIAF